MQSTGWAECVCGGWKGNEERGSRVDLAWSALCSSSRHATIAHLSVSGASSNLAKKTVTRSSTHALRPAAIFKGLSSLGFRGTAFVQLLKWHEFVMLFHASVNKRWCHVSYCESFKFIVSSQNIRSVLQFWKRCVAFHVNDTHDANQLLLQWYGIAKNRQGHV